ncbi:MAG: hypothetical protein GY795_41210 [Desulfobacterales bacterium]|nr:hypothetical protein [Desulfobacterales bacterium]
MPKFHFGTPSDCQLKNEGCQKFNKNRLMKKKPIPEERLAGLSAKEIEAYLNKLKKNL